MVRVFSFPGIPVQVEWKTRSGNRFSVAFTDLQICFVSAAFATSLLLHKQIPVSTTAPLTAVMMGLSHPFQVSSPKQVRPASFRTSYLLHEMFRWGRGQASVFGARQRQ
jgi:hypothetical protein